MKLDVSFRELLIIEACLVMTELNSDTEPDKKVLLNRLLKIKDDK